MANLDMRLPVVLSDGVPDSTTPGWVGLLAMDTTQSSKPIYKCIKAENEVYTWALLESGGSGGGTGGGIINETDPTVPEWAKQPTKPSYTAAEVGALSASELQGAIDTALAQAKESGEFDGEKGDKGEKGEKGDTGETGKGLDILGTYTSVSELEASVLSPEQGDMYNVGTSAPYTVYMYDAVLGWVSQGQLQGAAGAVFTPSVSASGDLSWTNNGGLPNPDTVNIKGAKGDKGDTGEPGDKGEKGDKGDKGDTGAAGANGNDYVLTDADKTEIAQEAASKVDTSGYLQKSGDTMEGALVAQSNTNLTERQVRNIITVADGDAIPDTLPGDIVFIREA